MREVTTSMGIASRSHREQGSERDPCMYKIGACGNIAESGFQSERRPDVASMEQVRKELNAECIFFNYKMAP